MEFACGCLHLPRLEAAWHTPVQYVRRCMLAHLQRNGKQVDWGASLSEIIAHLDDPKEKPHARAETDSETGA